jgi:hypothetical protein
MDTLHHHQTLNNKKNHIDEFKSVAWKIICFLNLFICYL